MIKGYSVPRDFSWIEIYKLKYLLLFVSLLIFGFKLLTYGRIQTTLREQEKNKIKQYKSKEQFHKTVGRETRMFHDLTDNIEFISIIEINYSFSMYWISIYCLIMAISSSLTTIRAVILNKLSIINFSRFLLCVTLFFWEKCLHLKVKCLIHSTNYC